MEHNQIFYKSVGLEYKLFDDLIIDISLDLVPSYNNIFVLRSSRK